MAPLFVVAVVVIAVAAGVIVYRNRKWPVLEKGGFPYEWTSPLSCFFYEHCL